MLSTLHAFLHSIFMRTPESKVSMIIPIKYRSKLRFMVTNILYPMSMYVGFSTPPSNSVTPAGFPTNQLSSDPIYLEIASDQVKSPVPQDFPLTTFRSQLKVQVVTCASKPLTIDWRLQWPRALLGLD